MSENKTFLANIPDESTMPAWAHPLIRMLRHYRAMKYLDESMSDERPVVTKKITSMQIFRSKIREETEVTSPYVDTPCWIYTGSPSSNGYAYVNINGRKMAAHHVFVIDDRPWGMLVCHHCDHKLCVRPSHTFFGTHLDNRLDYDRKKRGELSIRIPSAT